MEGKISFKVVQLMCVSVACLLMNFWFVSGSCVRDRPTDILGCRLWRRQMKVMTSNLLTTNHKSKNPRRLSARRHNGFINGASHEK
uniref:Putative secreted protein n=1 Tax=Anopheles darlingi TaxID=43151 RepID=A0A2M4DEH2_ANODA